MSTYEITRDSEGWLLDNEYGPIARAQTMEEALARARSLGLAEITLTENGSTRKITLT